MSDTISKADLIRDVASYAGVSQADAHSVVEVLIEKIANALQRGDRVRIDGLGIFEPRHRAARRGRNPATGEIVDVPASTAVGFKPSKSLKDAVA